MHIHTVKPGDTIFKIAREYSSSPMKIIENNSLENPDRLSVGQKLLILTPTRTYTVRGGDNLGKIAERFGVKYEELLANNPYLSGTDKIYPGQLLSVKYDTPAYGMASANGYYYRGCTEDRLSLALPYLSYVTVACAKRYGDEIHLAFDCSEVLNTVRKWGKIPLARIYDETENKAPTERYTENILKLAKNGGFGGIMLASYSAMKANPKGFSEFLMRLKKSLMENNLFLFVEIDGNSPICEIADIADGYSLMYEKACLDDIPKFSLAERKAMENFAESFEQSKAYLEIPSSAYSGKEEITKNVAERLAYNSATGINTDRERGICYFDYNKYKGGRKEKTKVCYESLENIKAKLELVGELGFMGINFDIMKIPTEYLMLFETMFRRPPVFSFQDSGAM